MQAIRNAIETAAGDSESSAHIWASVKGAMLAQGMILFDKPVTVAMLNRQIEETAKFEVALAEVAQELNEALGDFDHATTRDDIGRTLTALVGAVRRSVKMAEQANPNWPLYKDQEQGAHDRLWEHHMLRGTAPSEEAIIAARKSDAEAQNG
ncbi:MAG: hypothetical protein PHV02_03225 [Rhodocyclaceae bacterium]|nr:hypothetical protein [Rhodocyclaceae bacterium]